MTTRRTASQVPDEGAAAEAEGEREGRAVAHAGLLMRREWWLVIVLLPAIRVERLGAQTLWDRRDRNMATLFHDYRARNVGDVLTVFIEEATGFDAQEKRELDKKTN